MKKSTNLTFLLVVVSFLFMGLQTRAQSQNYSMEPSQAEQYISTYWTGTEITLKNITIDQVRLDAISKVLEQSTEITTVKFYKGVISEQDVIMAVGKNNEGVVIGNYYISDFSNDVGPCPNACD